MKAKILLSLIVLGFSILLLHSCSELCDWYESQYIQQCQAQPTGLVANNVGDHYQKTATVWNYRFDLPGDSWSNCDFKFLENKAIQEVDSIELVRWQDHNVGNAMYKVKEITDINSDTALYILLQIRETFQGVYNNDAVCDGGNLPQMLNHYVRFKQCKQYAVINDSFGLKIH